MEHSHLLSLPKELRLEIWRYTVTDPSSNDLILRIDRDYSPCPVTSSPSSKSYGNSLRQWSRFHTTFKATFEEPRNCPVSVNLLRSNRLIYQEALPFLYHSVTFSPSSMFAEYLGTLSDFAKQHIRKVRLYMDQHIELQYHFSWAVMCAQVATLPCIRDVEVVSSYVQQSPPSRIMERLLRPLLKIKAPKRLIPKRDDAAFQSILVELTEEMNVEKAARRQKLERQDAQKTARGLIDAEEGSSPIQAHRSGSFCPLPVALKQAIANSPYAVEESERVEQEVEEWDLVSIRSFESETKDGHSKLVTGMDMKNAQSGSNDEDSLVLRCDDWELVDPDPSADDDATDRPCARLLEHN